MLVRGIVAELLGLRRGGPEKRAHVAQGPVGEAAVPARTAVHSDGVGQASDLLGQVEGVVPLVFPCGDQGGAGGRPDLRVLMAITPPTAPAP